MYIYIQMDIHWLNDSLLNSILDQQINELDDQIVPNQKDPIVDIGIVHGDFLFEMPHERTKCFQTKE